MIISNFLGEAYFYANHEEAAEQITGSYYIVHSRRVGESISTGTKYAPSMNRKIEVEAQRLIDPGETAQIDTSPENLRDIFGLMDLKWDNVECMVQVHSARSEYPEEIHCELTGDEQDSIAQPTADGLVKALYNPFEDGHIISFGYKINEDNISGYQFVQMEIQRMNPMERYLIVGIKPPKGLHVHAYYELDLQTLENQPLDPLNAALEAKEKEENSNWHRRMDTRGTQYDRESGDSWEPRFIVFRRFAQKETYREPYNGERSPGVEHYDNDIGLSYESGTGEYHFKVFEAEQFQDGWSEELGGRLKRMRLLECDLADQMLRMFALAEAWEYHATRYAEMAEEMLLGELAGGSGQGELAEWSASRRENIPGMKEKFSKFAKKWSA